VDLVFGFGRTSIVSQKVVGPLVTQESRTAEAARYATQSVNLAFAYEIIHGLEIGLMVPLGTGSVYPGSVTRGSTTIGNVAVGGEYGYHVRPDLELKGGLDVALPTAQGTELPTPDDLAALGHLDQTTYDRFSLQRAIADSRGREDTAAYAPKHLGLVPKVALSWTGVNKLEIEPYLKYESLHGLGSDTSYEGALVIAARGTYRFHKFVDGTLRIWTNIPTAGPDSAVAIVEPEVRGHFGAFVPVVGVIIPFAGELTSPGAVGARLALAARF
jgi:hypothetical protein